MCRRVNLQINTDLSLTRPLHRPTSATLGTRRTMQWSCAVAGPRVRNASTDAPHAMTFVAVGLNVAQPDRQTWEQDQIWPSTSENSTTP